MRCREREGPPDQKPGCCPLTQAGHPTALEGNEAASLGLTGFLGLGDYPSSRGSQLGGSPHASGEEAFISLGPFSTCVCVTYVFQITQVETQVFILPFLHKLPQGYGWWMKGRFPYRSTP